MEVLAVQGQAVQVAMIAAGGVKTLVPVAVNKLAKVDVKKLVQRHAQANVMKVVKVLATKVAQVVAILLARVLVKLDVRVVRVRVVLHAQAVGGIAMDHALDLCTFTNFTGSSND